MPWHMPWQSQGIRTAADQPLKKVAQIFAIFDVRLEVHEHQERDPNGHREDIRAEDRQALVREEHLQLQTRPSSFGGARPEVSLAEVTADGGGGEAGGLSSFFSAGKQIHQSKRDKKTRQRPGHTVTYS